MGSGDNHNRLNYLDVRKNAIIKNWGYDVFCDKCFMASREKQNQLVIISDCCEGHLLNRTEALERISDDIRILMEKISADVEVKMNSPKVAMTPFSDVGPHSTNTRLPYISKNSNIPDSDYAITVQVLYPDGKSNITHHRDDKKARHYLRSLGLSVNMAVKAGRVWTIILSDNG